MLRCRQCVFFKPPDPSISHAAVRRTFGECSHPDMCSEAIEVPENGISALDGETGYCTLTVGPDFGCINAMDKEAYPTQVLARQAQLGIVDEI